MAYRIACQCGKGVFAELPDAGGTLTCSCGRFVPVPTRRQLLRMPPVARRDTVPRPLPDAESTRTIASATRWLLAGVVFLAIGVLLGVSMNQPPGPCIGTFGVGMMLLGGVRFVRGLIQRQENEGKG